MGVTKLNKDNNSSVVKKKLYVKYMVCLRDKMILRTELDKMGIRYDISVHGAVEFLEEITYDQFLDLKKNLSDSGLFLLNETESLLVDRIINTIIEVIHYTDELPKVNFSDLISEYTATKSESILKIFSDVKGMSILQFIVVQKIERAKELLLYDDMSLSEIAEILNYKNKHYFVAQFKKSTGLMPSYFKTIKKDRARIAAQHSGTSDMSASGMKSRSNS